MVNYDPIEDPDQKDCRVIKVKLNMNEIRWIRDSMFMLRQDKISTAIKQLAEIGYEEVVQDKKISKILDTISENQRRNWEAGRDYKAIIKSKVDPFLYEK